MLNELTLFAGAGGGILGGCLLGWRTVAAVEIDPYCREVLLRRQLDGCLPRFPIWDDVRTFDGIPWRGLIDVISGGFPCQDISSAGRGAGIDGPKSGLWSEFARIIREVRPRYAFVENSPMLTVRGLDRVLGDLAEMGYDARWCVLGADDVGAPHIRKRIWILADAKSNGCGSWRPGRSNSDNTREQEQAFCNINGESKSTLPVDAKMARMSVNLPNPDGNRLWEQSRWISGKGRPSERESTDDGEEWTIADFDGNGQQTVRQGGDRSRTTWWDTEPAVDRVAHGVASRVDRLKAIGNGQIPAVAKLAWDILTKGMMKS